MTHPFGLWKIGKKGLTVRVLYFKLTQFKHLQNIFHHQLSVCSDFLKLFPVGCKFSASNLGPIDETLFD